MMNKQEFKFRVTYLLRCLEKVFRDQGAAMPVDQTWVNFALEVFLVTVDLTQDTEITPEDFLEIVILESTDFKEAKFSKRERRRIENALHIFLHTPELQSPALDS